MLRVLLLACFLSGALAVIIREGACNWNTIDSVKNWNITALTGTWNQLQRIENPGEHGDCSTLTIEIETNNSIPYLYVTNREVHDKHDHVIKERINFVDETLGLFTLTYGNYTYDTVLLRVDYTKYAILYSCTQISVNETSVVAWIYGRETSLPVVDQVTILSIINLYEDLRNATWRETEHTGEACSVSAGMTFQLSPVLAVLAVIIVGKNILTTK